MGCNSSKHAPPALAAGEVGTSSTATSGAASDLSASQFASVDVAVALTQTSVNATMLEYISSHGTEPVTMCYVYNSSGALVSIDYDTLKANSGVDPFELTNGANQTDPTVLALAEQSFAGAFRAAGGLPEGIPINQLPSVVALGLHSDSAVTYTLLCSTFQICGITYEGFANATAVNAAQPTGSGATPWYFTFTCDLANVPVDPNGDLPADVRSQMNSLLHTVGEGAFSIQQLLLDLDTMVLAAPPPISGISDSSTFGPIWTMMSEVFTGAYFAQLRESGSPVFSYGVTVTKAPEPSTIVLKEMQICTTPYKVSGVGTASPASCLTYLCTTQSTPPPIIEVPWNWVSSGDVSSIAGVIAVRRGDFVGYFRSVLNGSTWRLLYDPHVKITQPKFDEYDVYDPWVTLAASPTEFEAVDPPTQNSDGSWLVMKLSFSSNSSADCTASDDMSSLHQHFNTQVDASVSFSGTQMLVKVHSIAQMDFTHHEVGVHYTDLPLKNYLDKTITITYDMAITSTGDLTCTETSSVADNSAAFDFTPKGILGSLGVEDNVKNGWTTSEANLNSTLSGSLTGFADSVTSQLNSYRQFVFPGSDTFAACNVFFSDSLDLVTQVTYQSVSAMPVLKTPMAASAALGLTAQAHGTDSTAVDYTIQADAELMANYHVYDILDPQDKFLAAQAKDGCSLLFAIDSTGDFRVIVEQTGRNQHGWSIYSLSDAVIKADFANTEAAVSTFSVSQPPGTNSQATRLVNLAMSVQADGQSHLYLSLGNSDTDLSWVSNISWVKASFNATDSAGTAYPQPDPFVIANVSLSVTSAGEYIFVDTLRNTEAAEPLVSRWYIDASKNVPLWDKHNISSDFEASSYHSCIGRAGKQFIDGVYTIGQINGNAQFTYAPLFNVFDPAAPVTITLLNLPGGIVPEAIAAARHSNGDEYTDLYVAAQGGLYYFSSTNQANGATGVLVVSDALHLSGVTKLFAAEDEGVVTIWGLNGSDSVFYVTCDVAYVLDESAWSIPLPILTGVDAITPYVDRKFLANTFFAHSGDGLLKYTKTPSTGLWTSRNITLAPSNVMQDPKEIKSFTTHILVTESTTGQNAASVNVQLTATTVTTVCINHLYYRVGPQPVVVPTDQDGTITIVELTTQLVATQFVVAVVTDGTGTLSSTASLSVNPMSKALARNAAYDTTDKLKSATITADDGTRSNFVPDGVSDDDLNKLASCNVQLKNAADSQSGVAQVAERGYRKFRNIRKAATPLFADSKLQGSTALHDIGDLYSFLATGAEAIIDIALDDAGVYYFIATVEGSVMSAVLDDVEAIASAIVWLYNKTIGKLIDLILEFLAYLFGWDSILVTHNVLKTFLKLTAQDSIDQLDAVKGQFQSTMDNLKTNIADFAGVTGVDTTTPGASQSGQASSNSAPGNLGVHHAKGNASSATTPDLPPEGDPSAMQTMLDMAEQVEQTLLEAVNLVQSNVIAPLPTLSFTQVTELLAGIVGVTVVGTLEDMGLELFNVLESSIDKLMPLVDAPLNIPVLSYMYKKLTNGDQLSFLDLFCLVAAIPTTIKFKELNEGKSPWTNDDPVTQRMLSATTIQEWNNAPYAEAHAQKAQLEAGALLGSSQLLSDDDVQKLKGWQLLGLGFCGLAGSILRVMAWAGLMQNRQAGEFMNKKLATISGALRFVGAIAADAQSYSPTMFDDFDWDSSAWYITGNRVLLISRKCRNFLEMLFAPVPSEDPQTALVALMATQNLACIVCNVVTVIKQWPGQNGTDVLVVHYFGRIANNLAACIMPIWADMEAGVEKAKLTLVYSWMRQLSGVMDVAWPALYLVGNAVSPKPPTPLSRLFNRSEPVPVLVTKGGHPAGHIELVESLKAVNALMHQMQ